ncbi:MAG: DUF4430 domain-containing protein [Actinomycetota bacterium]
MDTAERSGTRAWWYAWITVLVLVAVFFTVRGCAFMPWNEGQESVVVRLSITRDFGGEVLRDEDVEVREGSSAMQALQKAAEVETSYGGGFIRAVDGLVSGYDGEGSSKTDWFYYVNGQMAEVGAGDFEVRDGDWLIFDYHSWEYSVFTPAFAGCFPEPFVHGFREAPRECLIVCAPGCEDSGERLAEVLREAGAPTCDLEDLNPGWRPRQGEYAVVVGTAAELAKNHFIAEASANAARIGLTAYIAGADILLVDGKGEASGCLASGEGLIEAIGPRLGEEGSALMVIGTDVEGVRAAVGRLAGWDNRSSGPAMVVFAGADMDGR